MPSRWDHGKTGSQVIGLGTPEPTSQSPRACTSCPAASTCARTSYTYGTFTLLPLSAECPSANKGGRQGTECHPGHLARPCLSKVPCAIHVPLVANVALLASARKWRERGGFENKRPRALIATDSTTSMGRQTALRSVWCSLLVVIPGAILGGPEMAARG
ncbi:hypothetical protein V8C42DRAFT_317533 [Trichoderma barbatum]